jgi:TrmH family RNA methyltransferase
VIDSFRAARRDRALVVLEGLHAVKHALRFGAVVTRVAAGNREVVGSLARRIAPDVAARLEALIEEVPGEVFAQLVPRPPHTGVVAIARRPDVDVAAVGREAPAVLLDAPRHAQNLGACVRVAAGAGASGLLVAGGQDPWTPEALRGSAGLHFALPVLAVQDPPADRPLVAFDPDGAPFDPRTLAADAVIAFGSERQGLTPQMRRRADAVVALPMRVGVSSLNLATSVSAALYAWRLSGP